MPKSVTVLLLAIAAATALGMRLAGQGTAPERQLIVRAALDAGTRLTNLRKQGNLQLVDVTVRQGDTLTLAVNDTSNLPAWVSYVGPNANLGDVSYRTAFSGYVPEKGIQLPIGIATTIDFRNVVQSKLYVDRNIVDAPTDDLSAPASVRSPRPPQGGPAARNANLKPIKVADHVWFMNGNTFFEFDDHLTMVEANRPDAALQATLKVADSLVPGKRVTQVIRRSPRPLKFIPVDDHLKLKDATNEVDIYHVVGNYHMADGVIVHVPASNLLVEADLTTQNWDFNWWGDSLMNNIEHRRLKVVTNLAVHAQQPFPLADVVSAIEKQVRNAQAFCRRGAEAQFFQPGCPIQYNRPLPPVSN